MNTTKTSMIVVASLLLCCHAESQELERIIDGVYVMVLPGEPGTTTQNLGVVEFDDFLLVVDACERDSWYVLSEIIRGITTKPVRYLAHTHGMAGNNCDGAPDSVMHLVPSATGRTEFRVGNPAIATDVVLGAEPLRTFLRRVRVDGGEDAWTVYVRDRQVLFAGDLVGRGRGASPLPIDSWMAELHRLVRLTPDVVVPGNGPIGDVAMLRETLSALGQARTAITDMVDSGRSRENVIERVVAIGGGLLDETLASHLYDEYVGILPATGFIERLGFREGGSPTAQSPEWTEPRSVVVADLWPGRTAQIGLAAPNLEVFVADDPEHAADLVESEDADAILGWLTPEILERGESLRWVSLFSAGVESYLGLPGFAESDIVLTNGQRIYANGGAEHVLGMVLALSRRLNTAVRLQSQRRWDNAPLTGPTPITGGGSELGELRGKTILIAGLGGIGTEVARLAHGIGMRVIATRASRREGPPFVEYVGLANELTSLVSEADVIVNCLPLTAETGNVFDEHLFRYTKSTGYLINIGRGKTVDTDALVRALHEGRIAGAGLDVTEPEPLPGTHELWGMSNVIITPHVGGDSERHMERIWLLFRENLRRFAAGEPLLSVVDKRRGY